MMCYGRWGQQSEATGGSANNNKPPAGEDIGTDSDSSDGNEKSPNELVPTETAFYWGGTLEAVESSDAAI